MKALPRTLHIANEGLAFLLELVMLAVLARWGATFGSGVAARVLLGIGVPVAAAAVWGLFAAPRARIRLPMTAVLAVKALVFAAAAAAIYAVGQHVLAIFFALVAFANAAVAATDRDAVVRAQRQKPTEPVPPGAA